MRKWLYTFNPYVLIGAFLIIIGAYSITENFNSIPRVIITVGVMSMVYGYWNYDEIEHMLRIMRKLEEEKGRGNRLRNRNSRVEIQRTCAVRGQNQVSYQRIGKR